MYDKEKGLKFIEDNIIDGHIKCFLSTARDLNSTLESPKEVGSALFVLELLRNYISEDKHQELISYITKTMDEDGSFHFFEDKDLLPNDTDTTSWGLSTLLDLNIIDEQEARKQAERIAKNTDDTGLIQTYYNDYQRIRKIDPTALMNILHFLYKTGISADEFKQTLDLTTQIIKTYPLKESGRYYFSDIPFLYYAMRVANYCSPIKTALENIIQSKNYIINGPLDLSMIVSIKKFLNMEVKDEEAALIALQQQDGSFPFDSLYMYGTKDLYFGSKVLSTAFALHALLKD